MDHAAKSARSAKPPDLISPAGRGAAAMGRPLLPKEEPVESPTNSDGGMEAKAAKRRCISSACNPCRKRKSKCDGGVPSCSSCAAVYHTECAYDLDHENRRKTVVPKRDPAPAGPAPPTDGHATAAAWAPIVDAIRQGSDAEVADIVHHIRAGERLETIAESLKEDVSLLGRSGSHSLETDLADIVGTTKVGRSGETRVFGHTSSLGLVPNDDEFPAHPDARTETWTKVTRDAELVEHLMSLYFCWQHPFYVLFSQECFRHDMARGRPKYCSSLLVNAILACACLFSDRPQALADVENPRTAGDHFFAEARRLLFADERSSLTTVQALGVMSIREAICSRDSAGYRYAGRCMRMALELGLHLCFNGAGARTLTPTEIEVRKITFWGCFNFDTAWSICIGRVSQMPRTAISVKKPMLAASIENKPWKPYVDSDVAFPAQMEQPGHTHKHLQQFSFLSEIVNDTIIMFYAPRERFTSKKLRDFHARYTQWYQALPSELALSDHSTPQVINLHMYYHTVVLHLFRPFLKVDLLESTVSPRAVCTESAENISILADGYRNLYTLRRTCLLMAHCLLSASTIHLLNISTPSAQRHLTHGLRDLDEMSFMNPFAARCARIVTSLAQKWAIDLPDEASEFGKRASMEPPSPVPSSEHLVTVSDGGPPPPRPRQGSVTELLPVAETTTAPASSLSDLFWTSFPYQGIPLQVTMDPGPMDISTLLDVSGDNWEQYTRDGFKMAYGNDLPGGGGYLGDEVWAPTSS